jgi:hypothetical protein
MDVEGLSVGGYKLSVGGYQLSVGGYQLTDGFDSHAIIEEHGSVWQLAV